MRSGAGLAAEDWSLGLDPDGVLRAQGADPQRVRAARPRLLALAQGALDEGVELLEPRAVWRLRRVVSTGPDGVRLAGGGALGGPLPARRLACARLAAALVVTIGGALEERVSELLGREPARALALDGLGTAAVTALAAEACRRLREAAARRGMRATAPISPGMRGWPAGEGQRELFDLLGERLAGARLTRAGVMIPRKSLSMVVGLGRAVDAGERTCDACGALETCRFRSRDAGPPG